MQEKALEMLQAFAEKLNTTAEYLWQVMVRQALVAGVTDLVIVAVWIAVAVATWKVHKHLSKPFDKPEDGGYSWEKGTITCLYFRNDSGPLIAMCVFAVVLLGAGVGVLVGVVPDMITAFLNPEYWALKEILRVVK